jgi:hypothetical protein
MGSVVSGYISFILGHKMSDYYCCPTTCNCACNDKTLNERATHHRRVMADLFTLAIKEGDYESIIRSNLARAIAKRDVKMLNVLNRMLKTLLSH